MLRTLPILALLSGCWPLIPGKWADYDVPAETQIVGEFNYYQKLGGYWDDTTAEGDVAWGWLDTPQVGLQAVQPRPGCELVAPDEPGDPLDFIDIGASEARMRSSLGTIELEFEAPQNRFADTALTADDVAAGASWTLDNVDSDEGTFFVSTFVVMPPRFAFEGFLLDGDIPDQVQREDYDVTWQPESGAEWVLLKLQIERGGSVVETARCYAEARDGAVTVPMDVWTQMDTAEGMYVDLGSSHETASKIEGVYGASRIGAVWFQRGYVRFD